MDPTSAPPDPPLASKIFRANVLRAIAVAVSLAILVTIWFGSRGYRPLDELPPAVLNACLADGSNLGAWRSEFAGYGCNTVVESEGEKLLRLSPKPSSKPDETHAALFVGPAHGPELDMTCQVRNLRQLRTGSAPNPWEVGWVVWGYRDRSHFYYFALKPNGWELGKVDPAYRGGQRFLASGEATFSKLGEPETIHVRQIGANIVVSVDGQEMARFEDRERPYQSGHIAVYCEDAEVLFGDIVLKS